MEEINAKERKEKEEEEETGMEVTWSMENQSKSVAQSESGDEDGSEVEDDDDVSIDDDEDIKNNLSGDAGDNGEDDDGFNDPFFSEPTGAADKSAGDKTTSVTMKKKKKTKKKNGPLTEEEKKQKVFYHSHQWAFPNKIPPSPVEGIRWKIQWGSTSRNPISLTWGRGTIFFWSPKFVLMKPSYFLEHVYKSYNCEHSESNILGRAWTSLNGWRRGKEETFQFERDSWAREIFQEE